MVEVTVLVAGASGSVGRRLCPALAETAYYLVHTLSDASFEHKDGAVAVSGEAGVQAWLQRIISWEARRTPAVPGWRMAGVPQASRDLGHDCPDDRMRDLSHVLATALPRYRGIWVHRRAASP